MAADPLDLITTAESTAYLAAGGVTLTAAQTTQLQALVTAASKEIQREINRWIPAANYDEIIQLSPGRRERGEASTGRCSAYPVNNSPAPIISGGRVTALNIRNSDASTNQIARVSFVETGDPEVQITTTGLTLTRVASGTTTTSTLTWASYTTVTALATAINALGGGWVATVANNMGLWATTELVGAREVRPAFTGVDLDVFSLDLPASIDRRSGVIRMSYNSFNTSGPWNGSGWVDEDNDDYVGGYGQQVRVRYNGGYSTIPAALQEFTALTIKGMIDQLTIGGGFDSETMEDYSYKAKSVIRAMPDDVRRSLQAWKPYEF